MQAVQKAAQAAADARKEENFLKRETPFLCNVRFRCDLPEVGHQWSSQCPISILRFPPWKAILVQHTMHPWSLGLRVQIHYIGFPGENSLPAVFVSANSGPPHAHQSAQSYTALIDLACKLCRMSRDTYIRLSAIHGPWCSIGHPSITVALAWRICWIW